MEAEKLRAEKARHKLRVLEQAMQSARNTLDAGYCPLDDTTVDELANAVAAVQRFSFKLKPQSRRF